MKKLLLNLGVISISTVPLLAIASCSLTQQTIDLGITEYSTVTTVKAELVLSTINSYKAAEAKYKEAKNEEDRKIAREEQVTSLNMVFIGVTASNFDNFTVTYGDAETAKPWIKLNGIENYVFSGQKILTAKPSSAPTKQIGTVTGTDKTITLVQYNEFKLAFDKADTPELMIATLNQLLSGVGVPDISNFIIKTDIKSKIIFIAKPDYYFETVDKTSIVITVSGPVTTVKNFTIASKPALTKLIYDAQLAIFNSTDLAVTPALKIAALLTVITVDSIPTEAELALFTIIFAADKLTITSKDLTKATINGLQTPFVLIAPTTI